MLCAYAVLAVVSNCYPPVWGRLPTRYSPVRHSVTRTFIPKKSSWSASFDLHVLGTPPAFILSQDQTLMLKSLSFKSLIFPESLLAYSDNSEFTVLRLLLFTEAFVCQSSLLVLTAWNLLSICWSILESFKVYSLFSYQGSLWFFQTVLLSATFIGYHIFKSLSTTFFIFFIRWAEKEGFEPSRRY